MESNQSVTYPFDHVSTQEQQNILDLCMRQDKITWKILLAKLFPEFKNKVYLSFLIENHKKYVDAQSPSSPQDRAPTKKIKVTEILPRSQ